MLKLNSILIGSEDPEKLGAFYGRVLGAEPGWQNAGFTGYDAGGFYLMVGPHDKVHGSNAGPERLLFNFESDHFDADFARVAAVDGIKVVREPYHPGDDAAKSLATFADPDGNYFQLATPMG